MNQAVQTRAESKAPIAAGGEVAAIIPRSLDEVWRLSTAIASAPGMAPRGMEKPEQIMVAIMAGSELGMPPFQALQSFAVVNGRPTLWGDGLMAVVKARGVKVREWFEHEDDTDRITAHCEVTRPDNGEVTLGRFSVADAKKAGLWNKQGPWQQYPKRMLKMRARVALRDGCADMLRGFQIREEVEDYTAVREVKPSGLRARLQSAEPAQTGFARSDLTALPDHSSEAAGSSPEAAGEGGGPPDEATPHADEPLEVLIDADLDGATPETILAWVAVYRAAMAAATRPTGVVALRKAAFDGGQLKAVHAHDEELQVELDREIKARADALKAPPPEDDVFPGDLPLKGGDQ